MKALIIYAHPNTTGHNPLILEETKKELKQKKVDFDIIDLYKIKYDPVMHEEEHYTSGNYKRSKQTLKFQDMIMKADLQIYIYPIWWGSMPAILKGFFDKVFTSHYAFKYVNGFPVGLLKGKKAIVMATCGAPGFFYKFVRRNPRWLIKDGILGFCGVKAKVNIIPRSLNIDDKRKEKIKRFVRKSLRSI